MKPFWIGFVVGLVTFLLGMLFGASLRPAHAQKAPLVVGCYAKGGVTVAGWCVSRSVIIR